MMQKLKLKEHFEAVKNLILKNNLIALFLFVLIFAVLWGIVYTYGLSQNENDINEVIKKFTYNDYAIPYYVAERYLIWLHSRTFLFSLHYFLELMSIFSSLIVAFYASSFKKGKGSKGSAEQHSKQILLLSMISMCLTVAGMIVNPNTVASATQHAWRELDSCIIQTINNEELTPNEKDCILAAKISELENYIEIYEN